ncbi:MAG: GNAT family N-acetyltransferase [Deltaproteobacteria bacterium]|nr:GNAT family N-acetyltransferase [Deltaproteobacteria bacterium]
MTDPDALSLRAATPDDYRWLLHFLPQLETGDPLPSEESFRTHYQGRLSLFAAPAAAPVAIAIVDVLADTGYVRVIAVDPHARGQGVGLALMRAIAIALREQKCSHWCLNVKVDNHVAIRLYERVGMRLAYHSHALRCPWAATDTLPSSTQPVVAQSITERDDPAIERAWSLPAGQLAGWRAMPGQHLIGLSDPGDPTNFRLGFARANPSHPGVFPFRVSDPTLARSLLEAVRPLFDGALTSVGIVVEDDEALASLLLAHGAERKMHLAHLRGVIPW